MRMMALHGSDNNGYANARTTYLFRTKDSRMAAVWQGGVSAPMVSRVPAVGHRCGQRYGTSLGEHDGYTALFRRKLEPGSTQDLVLAKKGADVDGVFRIGRQQRIVGATYVATSARSPISTKAWAN
jgi:hypothetical protein